MRRRPVKCATCKTMECYEDGVDCFEGIGDPRERLDDEDRRVLTCASEIEAEYYCRLTRIEEIVEFCRRMGYKRLGVAFCVGMAKEAKVLGKILAKDFVVYSVCCKACGIRKDELGLKKINEERDETMCNPVGQAMLLDSQDTQLNLICGLCLGHDILFTKHSTAPVTTFCVKDRVLAHNPLGALYSRYYRTTKFGID